MIKEENTRDVKFIKKLQWKIFKISKLNYTNLGTKKP